MVSLMSLSLNFLKGVCLFAPLSLPSREAATSPSLTLPHHTCRRPTDPSHPHTQPWPRKRVRGQPPNRSCLPSPRSAAAVCCVHANWTRPKSRAFIFRFGFLGCATAQIEGLEGVLPCSRARRSPPTHPPCCRTDVRTGHGASGGIGWGGARRFLQAPHCHHRCVCLWPSPRLTCAKECVAGQPTPSSPTHPPTSHTHAREAASLFAVLRWAFCTRNDRGARRFRDHSPPMPTHTECHRTFVYGIGYVMH
jgi:hypothetical protein